MSDKWLQQKHSASTSLLNHGNWFPVFEGLLETIGVECTILLQWLINFHSKIKKSKGYEWNDEWFYCTVSTIEKKFKYSQVIQFRILKELEKLKLIETKKFGLPAKRHIRINMENVEALIENWECNGEEPQEPLSLETTKSGSLEIPKSGSHLSNTKINNISMSTGVPVDCDILSSASNEDIPKKAKKVPSPFDNRAAEELHKVVEPRMTIRANMKQWAEEFRKMREFDKVPKEDIKKAIEWYKEHIGQDYIPEAFSAATFRRKYKEGKFTAAMNRIVRNGNDGKPLDKNDPKHPVQKVMSVWLTRNGLFKHPDQDEVNVILKELGLPQNSVKARDL